MRRVAGITAVAAACLLIVIVIAIPFGLAALFGEQDGDALAERQVEAAAEGLEEQLGYVREERDAESIAAEWFRSSSSEVTPVAWTGSTTGGAAAVIDVRVRADVEARGGGFGNGRANTAGSAERCYRFTLVIFDDARRAEIDCADVPTHVEPPVATPPLALPLDADRRLEALLQAAEPSDPHGLAEMVRAEFTDPELSVDTALTPDGELVVAVGAAPSRDCLVRVRQTDGTIASVSFDRILLEPGEGGCTTGLYTAPAL